LKFALTELRYSPHVLKVPFFAGLDDASVVALSEHLKLATTIVGEPITQKGAPDRELLLLIKGAAAAGALGEPDYAESDARAGPKFSWWPSGSAGDPY
jgi:hypothetical protein